MWRVHPKPGCCQQHQHPKLALSMLALSISTCHDSSPPPLTPHLQVCLVHQVGLTCLCSQPAGFQASVHYVQVPHIHQLAVTVVGQRQDLNLSTQHTARLSTPQHASAHSFLAGYATGVVRALCGKQSVLILSVRGDGTVTPCCSSLGSAPATTHAAVRPPPFP